MLTLYFLTLSSAVMHEKPCEMRGMFGEGMKETHKVLHVAESLIHMHLPKVCPQSGTNNSRNHCFVTVCMLTL